MLRSHITEEQVGDIAGDTEKRREAEHILQARGKVIRSFALDIYTM